MKSSTKPKGATSYKDTTFGVITRHELLKLEIEGTKKGLEYLGSLNLPPIEVKAETGKDRKRYLTAMQDADKGDFDLLETLIGQALTESLEKLQKTERKTDK